MTKHKRRLIYDLESNGFLGAMDRIHIICAIDVDTNELFTWNRNDTIDNIAEGVNFLQDAALLIGHNVIAFDAPAIKKIYPWFKCPPQEDTLVMARTMYSDIKKSDYGRLKNGSLPREMFGKHSLESWGYRLGLLKGDYTKVMKVQGLDPWGTWNQSMLDYCILDVQVTHVLWSQMNAIKSGGQKSSTAMLLPPEAEELEVKIHTIMSEAEADGFPFNKAEAEKLAIHFRQEKDRLDILCRDAFGAWFAPEKKYMIGPRWEVPNDDKVYAVISPGVGITDARAVWGAVTVPKVSNKKRNITRGVPYTKIKLVEFNPNSRTQIIDRLVNNYGWTPAAFTEKGTPEVNDDVLEALKDNIPIAGELANLMYYGKRLGQISEGAQAWLRVVKEDGRIHGTTNTGGAVTGRCTHYNPNMSQVPAVIKDKTGVKLGLEGKHGFESRQLFYTPPTINGEEWIQVGADLKGIELRGLGEVCAPFDAGDLINYIISGEDVHDRNMRLTGINDRTQLKRGLYACVPMHTTALTRRGWMSYEDLRVGEDIMTYNSNTQCKEWKPLLEKVYYKDAELMAIYTGENFYLEATPNHRWFTKVRRSPKHKDKYYTDCVCTTEELTSEHAIIQNAFFEGDEYLEGDRDWLLGPKYGTNWTERILGMSRNELGAFLAGFCIADGHWQISKNGKKPGKWHWSQNDGDIFEAALLASYLYSDKKLYVNKFQNEYNLIKKVKFGVNNNVTGQRLIKKKLDNAPVWCVKTENESWVMRQNDVITITGNTMYGAGDNRLGEIVDPIAPSWKQKTLGRELRRKLMRGLPALAKAIDEVREEAVNGYIYAIDGRQLSVRSPHSALNTKLQGLGAVVAKRWVVKTREYAEAHGLTRGWDGDFVLLGFFHDEQQYAVKKKHAELLKRLIHEAAEDAGTSLGMVCPIEADTKIGHNWAECH